jgi:hypothetical protein
MAKSSFKQEHPLGMLWCSLCFCLCIAVSVSRIFNLCMSRKVVDIRDVCKLEHLLHPKDGGRCILPVSSRCALYKLLSSSFFLRINPHLILLGPLSWLSLPTTISCCAYKCKIFYQYFCILLQFEAIGWHECEVIP